MTKTITVKGFGKVTAKPDLVVLSMDLEAKNLKYEKAMETAAKQLDEIKNSLLDIGFEKGSVKTASFNVRTNYEQIRDSNGNYKSVFDGYIVSHDLKLSFDFDSDLLAESLSAIAETAANPRLGIDFTVKDATKINEEMLCSATSNAKRKAEVLCRAAGVKMGSLLSIDYNWGEINIMSRTRFDMGEGMLAAPKMTMAAIDIEPDDIDLSDTATFVWEIN